MQGGRDFPVFQLPQRRVSYRREEARPNAGGGKIITRAQNACEHFVMGMALGELSRDGLQQAARFPGLENVHGLIFPRELTELGARFTCRNGFLQAALQRQVEPILGARVELEIHARGIANGAQQAHRLIGKAVDGKRAHFAGLEIGEAVGGIEQQTAGGGVERKGNGVQGEIAAAQVIHNCGPAHLGTRPRAGINLLASRLNAAVHVAREDHVEVPQLFVFVHDARSALLEFARETRRIALNGEIEVADGHSRNQIANGAAGEVDVGGDLDGQLLHAHQDGALLGGEPAFQHVHVVRHQPFSSLAKLNDCG